MFFTRRVEVVGFCLAWPHLVMTLPPRSARSAQPVSMLCRSDTDTGLLQGQGRDGSERWPERRVANPEKKMRRTLVPRAGPLHARSLLVAGVKRRGEVKSSRRFAGISRGALGRAGAAFHRHDRGVARWDGRARSRLRSAATVSARTASS
ncbi:hypothetical protein L1887_51200 [Cichorium endivia]|nr:hypothetical protein L1887_51200 [Cichorium endivia]